MTEKKILYFDCASGISGDMTLGALLDLGADEQKFLRELKKLDVGGYHIHITETQKNGIRAKQVKVEVDGVPEYPEEHAHPHEQAEHTHEHTHGHEQAEHMQEHGHEQPGHMQEHAHPHEQAEHVHEHTHVHEQAEHTHEHTHEHAHEHTHPHRNFADIRRIIENSDLDAQVKELSLRIFLRVAQAEAKVHGSTVDAVHFHEVGAVDSIVDIVGCAILICELKPQAVYASVLNEGHGFVHCQHGMLSVPVPAVSEIIAQAGASLRQIDVEGELVTPTGAAILAELAESFGPMPAMKVGRIGWGAGTKNFSIPNVLKVYEGYKDEAHESETENKETCRSESDNRETDRDKTENKGTDIGHDEIVVMEANLDDCPGELLGYAMEALQKAGALDVCYAPVFMKKNRPAYRLTVLARPEDARRLERIIFTHTTTIGLRKRREERSVLPRKTETLRTPYGELEVKKVFLNGEWRAYPEYESAVKLAEQNNLSLWEIYQSYE